MLLSVSLALGAAPPPLLAETTDQASVHSAYVINFVRYTQWPPPASEQPRYVIAVLGSAESTTVLRTLAERAGTIRGRPVVVRVLPLNTSAPAPQVALQALRSELGQPHVVYVAPSHRAWNAAVVAIARDRPILTIGVGDDFVEQGGMLGLVEARGRVGFTANNEAIRRASVDISARVMLLARPTQSTRPRGS